LKRLLALVCLLSGCIDFDSLDRCFHRTCMPGDGGTTDGGAPVTWTDFPLPMGDKRVYVSSSGGSDTNDGLTEATAVQTLAHGYSLLFDGSGDQLLLKRGDSFTDNLWPAWRITGRSAAQPLVISTYGTGGRPVILVPATADGFLRIGDARGNLALLSIAFKAATPGNGSGIRWVTASPETQNLLIEDCYFEKLWQAITIDAVVDTLTIQRSEILDTVNATTGGGIGLYVDTSRNISIQENIFQGTGASGLGFGETVNRGAVSIQSGNTSVAIRRNIVVDNHPSGIGAGCDATIEDNFFALNAAPLSVSNDTASGLVAAARSNVIVESVAFTGTSDYYSFGIALGRGALVENNIIANKAAPGPAAAIALRNMGMGTATARGNVVYNWPGVATDPGLGPLALDGNIFQIASGPQNPLVVTQAGALTFSGSANRYFRSDANGSWFTVDGTPTTLATWTQSIDPAAVTGAVTFTDPARSLAGFATGKGFASVDDLITQWRAQNRQSWNTNIGIDELLAYFRAGFAH
jgi:hypothetical protein